MRRRMIMGGLSAKDYVQNGLLLHLDGIENAGYGRHDSEASAWIDLTGNHTVVSSRTVTTASGQAPTWTNNAAWMRGDYAYATNFIPDILAAVNNNNCTIEIIWNYLSRGSVNNSGFFLMNADSPSGVRGFYFFDNANNCISSYSYRQTGYVSVSSGKSWTIIRSLLNGNKIVFNNKQYVNSNTGTVTSDEAFFASCSNCYIYAVRIYDRVLTADELAKNKNIDEKRFGITIPQ